MVEKAETYWNNRFIKEQFIWGTEPSSIAIICEKIFKENMEYTEK
jgi:hypothetical protein